VVSNGHTGDCTLGVRAEDIAIGRREGAHAAARVDVLENLGSDTLVHLNAGRDSGAELVARIETGRAPRPGDLVGLRFTPDRVHLFSPTGARLPYRSSEASGVPPGGGLP